MYINNIRFSYNINWSILVIILLIFNLSLPDFKDFGMYLFPSSQGN